MTQLRAFGRIEKKEQTMPPPYLFGSLLQRMIYHYGYYIGEHRAIRQNLGHPPLPQFVGNIDRHAPDPSED